MRNEARALENDIEFQKMFQNTLIHTNQKRTGLHNKKLNVFPFENSCEGLKDKYFIKKINDEIKLMIEDEIIYKVACQVLKEKDGKHRTYLPGQALELL